MSPLSLTDRLLPDNAADEQSTQQLLGDIKVAIPAIVQSFDATKQTVTVKCALLEKVVLKGSLTDIDVGLIADVPIIMPRAGGFSLTLPVAVGDECLLVFADGCIDAWFQSGSQQSRIDGRRHSLSDAFAVLGPWSKPRDLASYSTTAAQLRSDDGNTVIEVGAGEITIKANNVSVQAQQVTVAGSTNVHITGAGNTTIEGKNFLAHTHSGVQAGGGITGPVV